MQSVTKLRSKINCIQEKLGKPLSGVKLNYATRSDLGIPRKGFLKKQHGKHRSRKPQHVQKAWRASCTQQPSAARDHQADGTGAAGFGNSYLHLGGNQREYLTINPQNFRTLKHYCKTYPDVVALLSYFSFSQPQRFLEVSSGLDHASLE